MSAASRQRQRTHIPELLRTGRYTTVHAWTPEPGLTSLFDHAMEFPRPAPSFDPVSFDVEHLDVPPVLDHLRVLHAHERDEFLSFESEGHRYKWKGQEVPISVTGLIHTFAKVFDETAVIAGMRQGNNWPRASYIVPYASLDLLGRVKTIPNTAELVSLLERLPVKVADTVRQMIAADPTCRTLADMVSLSTCEIRTKWARDRRVAAARGTLMHAQLECLLNGGCVSSSSLEVCNLLQYLAGNGLTGACAFRTEWTIYASHEKLAGSIDFVARQADGSFLLLDWKRARDLKNKDQAFGRMMKSPLMHIPDAPLWHYRLQLNLYKKILEQYYGARVAAMYIVSLHPEYPVFVDAVPDLQAEAEAMMTFQRDCVGGSTVLGVCSRETDEEVSDADRGLWFSRRLNMALKNLFIPKPKTKLLSAESFHQALLKEVLPR